MQLTHSFRVPVGIDEAWAVLRDIERIAPCMPGASVDEVDGDHFTGGVKVKVGPITVTYRGEAAFVDVDEERHRASIEAKGSETRGSGTARATVHAELREVEDGTEVSLVTDLAVTGKPAQFGRGVMADVGAKLVNQFADCLSGELAASPAPAPETVTAAGTPAAPETAGVAVDPAAEAGIRGGVGAPPEATGVPLAAPALGASGTGPATERERTGPAQPAGEMPSPPATPPAARPRPSDDAIDLLGVAGTPILQRVLPIAILAAALLALRALVRRRRAR